MEEIICFVSDESVRGCLIFVACKYWLTCPCSISLLPKHRAYKKHPTQWACFLSIKPTKPSLLNEAAPWASSLHNPPCSTSLLTGRRAYTTFSPQRAYSLSIQLTKPFLPYALLEHRAYKTLPAEWASSRNNQLTKPSPLNKSSQRTSRLQNPSCSMSQLPEHRINRIITAQCASSLSSRLIKPFLRNVPAPWASSLQNRPCSMTPLPGLSWGLNLQPFTSKSNLIKIWSFICAHFSCDIVRSVIKMWSVIRMWSMIGLRIWSVKELCIVIGILNCHRDIKRQWNLNRHRNVNSHMNVEWNVNSHKKIWTVIWM